MDNLLLSCLLMIGMDHAQTLDIKHHAPLYESNPIMGRHPGDDTIHAYFSGVALFHVMAGRLATPAVTRAAHVFCVSTHADSVQNNITMGVSFSLY